MKKIFPWMLPSEFNSIDHTLGVLSMARAQDPNSAGSQFFTSNRCSNAKQ